MPARPALEPSRARPFRTLRTCARAAAFSAALGGELPCAAAQAQGAAQPERAAQAQGADAVGFAAFGAEDSGAAQTGDADAVGFGAFGQDGEGARAPSEAPAAPAQSASTLHLGATLWLQSALRTREPVPDRVAKLRQTVAAYAEWKLRLGSSQQLRARAAARSEVDFEYLRNAGLYDPASRAVYAWQVLPGETFLALETPRFELAFGEQIVNFGQGEVLSILDCVNPRDLREPLLADLSSLRMPVLMTRSSVSLAALRFELLAVHEAYFGLTPPPLGELSPFRQLLLGTPPLAAALAGRDLRSEHSPGHSLFDPHATQWHARLSWSGSGLDLSLVAASLLDPSGVPGLPAASAFDAPSLSLPIVHPRYMLLGQAGAWAVGAFVLRWEAAAELARALGVWRPDSSLPSFAAVRRHALRGMLGLTFAPSASTSAALELVQSVVLNNPARQPGLGLAPLFPVERPQIAVRVSHAFLRDRASIDLLALIIGVTSLNGWAARASVGYKLTDALELRLGYVRYEGSARFGWFYGLSGHDRALLDLRWDLTQ